MTLIVLLNESCNELKHDFFAMTELGKQPDTILWGNNNKITTFNICRPADVFK